MSLLLDSSIPSIQILIAVYQTQEKIKAYIYASYVTHGRALKEESKFIGCVSLCDMFSLMMPAVTPQKASSYGPQQQNCICGNHTRVLHLSCLRNECMVLCWPGDFAQEGAQKRHMLKILPSLFGSQHIAKQHKLKSGK